MTRLAAALLLLLPVASAAHPEHGPDEAVGLSHYLTEPYHVAIGAIVVVLFLLALRMRSGFKPVRIPRP